MQARLTVEQYRKLLIRLYGGADPTGRTWKDEFINPIEQAMGTLDYRSERILRARLQGRKLRELAAEWDISKERVRQLERKALQLLRDTRRLHLDGISVSYEDFLQA
jgi:RNA polymerase sigma factor (sigma-70 family)